MRLYLSSYRMGRHPHRLLELAGNGRRTALIRNALDCATFAPGQADEVLQRDIQELEQAGLQVTPFDLRDTGAVGLLAGFDILFLRGGNTFVLRKALAESGADRAIVRLLESDSLVYAGFSAGACVLVPDMSALAQVDDVNAVESPILSGLGILDRPFVPHVQSPGHPETEDCDKVSQFYRDSGQSHWALRDGEVLLVNGDTVELLR